MCPKSFDDLHGSGDTESAERTTRHQCVNIKHLKTAIENSDDIVVKSPDKPQVINKVKSGDKSIIQINLKLHHFYAILFTLILIVYLTH